MRSEPRSLPPMPRVGDTRVRRIFLWLPLTLPLPNSDEYRVQSRWLEYADVLDHCIDYGMRCNRTGRIIIKPTWKTVEWAA